MTALVTTSPDPLTLTLSLARCSPAGGGGLLAPAPLALRGLGLCGRLPLHLIHPISHCHLYRYIYYLISTLFRYTVILKANVGHIDNNFYGCQFLDRYLAISRPLLYVPVRTPRLIWCWILAANLLAGNVHNVHNVWRWADLDPGQDQVFLKSCYLLETDHITVSMRAT